MPFRQIPCLRAAFALLLLAHATAHGQGLLENMRALGRDAGKKYLEPAASTFGAAMGTGWFYRPPEKSKMEFSFDFGLAGTGGLFLRAPRHYTSSGTFSFNRLQGLLLVDSAFNALAADPRVAALSQAERDALRDTLAARVSGPDLEVTLNGPTAIGPENDSLYITFQGLSAPLTVPASGSGAAFDTTIAVGTRRMSVSSGGALASLPFIPMIVPRVTVGTLWGTQATLRWLPKVKLSEDIGKLGIIGLGLQHNLSLWWGPEAPVDITVDAHGQWLEVENTFTATSFSGGLVVSKTFGAGRLGIIPFGGAAWERSTIDADYDYTIDLPGGSEKRHADFQIVGDNNAHYTLGLALEFFHVNLTADYNFGSYDSISAGLMIML